MTLLFVAGSHTDVGKTHVACALLRTARALGQEVDALKLVQSGFEAGDMAGSDAGRLLEAVGRQPSPAALDAMAPLRFPEPLAPPLAARRHGVRLTRLALVKLANSWIAQTRGDLGLLEGAGGVMSPIADDATNLDLVDGLGLPVLLVGGAYLGAISHTLTAVEAIRSRGVPIAALVISGSPDRSALDFAETVALTRQFTSGIPFVAAPWGADHAWAAELLQVLPTARPQSRRGRR
jgi:dethiobiotin synthetase